MENTIISRRFLGLLFLCFLFQDISSYNNQGNSQYDFTQYRSHERHQPQLVPVSNHGRSPNTPRTFPVSSTETDVGEEVEKFDEQTHSEFGSHSMQPVRNERHNDIESHSQIFHVTPTAPTQRPSHNYGSSEVETTQTSTQYPEHVTAASPTPSFLEPAAAEGRHTENTIAEENIPVEAPSISETQTSYSTNPTISIIVLGRSGSGVSSTIRQLIGPATTCEKPEGNETLQSIYTYTLSTQSQNSSGYQLQFFDIPGFVDGRISNQDAQILSTLKFLITHTGPPNFFLALSNFDDNRIDGINSIFVQTIKRFDLFQTEYIEKLLGHKVPTVFLLTRLMSTTKSEQRRPTKRIATFERVINKYSSFNSSQYTIVVGDNHAKSEYDAEEQDGYYILPNKQLYPKNIYEAFIKETEAGPEKSSIKEKITQILTKVINNREVEMTCKSKIFNAEWEEYNADADAFHYLIKQENSIIKVDNTEVNLELNRVFDNLEEDSKRSELIQKTALQIYLQDENILRKVDLPETYPARAAFFQKSSLVSSTTPALLLSDAFQLEMPDYIEELVVGQGYDVLADEVSSTPFKNDLYIPNAVGYQLPNFAKCRKFFTPEKEEIRSLSPNIPDYFEERLKYLHFDQKENINVTKFAGKAKVGFNIKPEEGIDVATLGAIKEFRPIKCELANKINLELNNEFLEVVNQLSPVNRRDRDSIREWILFFGKYGSHIVTKGYGGGRLYGGVVIQGASKIRSIFNSESNIENSFDSILNFEQISVQGLEKPTYQLFGGDVPQQTNLYDLGEEGRDSLMKEWEKSLNSNFLMLTTDLGLERISNVVREKVSRDKGAMIDEAIELYLQGELTFKRKNEGKPNGGGNRKNKTEKRRPTTTTRRPAVTEATLENGNRRNYATEYESTPQPTQPYSIRPSHITPDRNYVSENRHPTQSGSGFSETSYGSGGTFSSFNYTADSPLKQLAEASLNNTNLFIKATQHEIKTKARNTQLRQQQEMAASQKHYEQMSDFQRQRYNTTIKSYETQSEFRQRQYEQFRENLNRQQAEEKDAFSTHIDAIKRQNEEADRRVDLYVKELERQWKEEEEKRKKCSGWNKLKPSCW